MPFDFGFTDPPIGADQGASQILLLRNLWDFHQPPRLTAWGWVFHGSVKSCGHLVGHFIGIVRDTPANRLKLGVE